LDAVLDALQAGPGQRRDALALIQAPRAERRLALLASPNQEADACPVPGDLLRTLRLRRGLSLRAAAAELGVSPSTLSRWERSETVPSGTHLRRLLERLGE
jgi:DNA-binding transcriptional regulator YiaG